jgi:hypothetical protein
MTIHLVLALSLTPVIKTNETIRKLEDVLRRFPSSDVVSQNYKFSRQHFLWTKDAGAIVPSHQRKRCAAHLAEAERLYLAWDSLDTATRSLKKASRLTVDGLLDNSSLLDEREESAECWLATAERYIETLEGLIGHENFALGRMPPPVPIWRFHWVD